MSRYPASFKCKAVDKPQAPPPTMMIGDDFDGIVFQIAQEATISGKFSNKPGFYTISEERDTPTRYLIIYWLNTYFKDTKKVL
jgi:hypothetical protein